MRSAANFRGHPVHPALIPFPFAFLTGAFAFNVAGVLWGRESLWTTGAHLEVAGVAAGVIAAIPGVIDLLRTVPPNSTGFSRARKHAALAITALVIFAIARWVRGSAAIRPDLLILVLQGLAVGALVAVGWMGGTLVSRNQISVDHRYAGAGKWSEARISDPGRGGAVVIDAEGLEVNQMRLLRIGSKRLVLGRTEKGFVVFDDRCTHRGGSLAGGVMVCGTVQCPWHGSQFDVVTGDVRAGPTKDPISAYPVEQRGSTVTITL